MLYTCYQSGPHPRDKAILAIQQTAIQNLIVQFAQSKLSSEITILLLGFGIFCKMVPRNPLKSWVKFLKNIALETISELTHL